MITKENIQGGSKMENVLFNEKDGIMFITINRPKALNALNSQTVNELGEVISSVEKRKDRCV